MEPGSNSSNKTDAARGCLMLNNNIYPVFEGHNTVGRNPGAIINIKSLNISQQHAIITIVDVDRHFISDLKSANGTQLNNVKLKPLKLYQLNNGASIKLADVFCTYKKFGGNEVTIRKQEESQIFSEGFYAADTQAISATPVQELNINEMATQVMLPINEMPTQVMEPPQLSINEMPTQIFCLEDITTSKINNSILVPTQVMVPPQLSINEMPTQVFSLEDITSKVKDDSSNDSIDFMSMQKMSELEDTLTTKADSEGLLDSDGEPEKPPSHVSSIKSQILPVKINNLKLFNSDDEDAAPASQICPVKTGTRNVIDSDSDTEEYLLNVSAERRKSRYVLSDDSETDIEDCDQAETMNNTTRDSAGMSALEINESGEEKKTAECGGPTDEICDGVAVEKGEDGEVVGEGLSPQAAPNVDLDEDTQEINENLAVSEEKHTPSAEMEENIQQIDNEEKTSISEEINVIEALVTSDGGFKENEASVENIVEDLPSIVEDVHEKGGRRLDDDVFLRPTQPLLCDNKENPSMDEEDIYIQSTQCLVPNVEDVGIKSTLENDDFYMQPTQQLLVDENLEKINKIVDDVFDEPTQEIDLEFAAEEKSISEERDRNDSSIIIEDHSYVEPPQQDPEKKSTSEEIDESLFLQPSQALEFLHKEVGKPERSTEVEDQLELLFATQSNTFAATQQLVDVLEEKASKKAYLLDDDDVIDDSISEDCDDLKNWTFKKPQPFKGTSKVSLAEFLERKESKDDNKKIEDQEDNVRKAEKVECVEKKDDDNKEKEAPTESKGNINSRSEGEKTETDDDIVRKVDVSEDRTNKEETPVDDKVAKSNNEPELDDDEEKGKKEKKRSMRSSALPVEKDEKKGRKDNKLSTVGVKENKIVGGRKIKALSVDEDKSSKKQSQGDNNEENESGRRTSKRRKESISVDHAKEESTVEPIEQRTSKIDSVKSGEDEGKETSRRSNRRKKDESQESIANSEKSDDIHEASTTTKDQSRITKSRAKNKTGSVNGENVKIGDNEDKEPNRRRNTRKKNESQESTKSLEKLDDSQEVGTGDNKDKGTSRRPIRRKKGESQESTKSLEQLDDGQEVGTGDNEDKETRRRPNRRKKRESQESTKSLEKLDDGQEVSTATKDESIVQPGESVKTGDNEDKETDRRSNRRKKNESQDSTKSLETPGDSQGASTTIKDGGSVKTGDNEDKETSRRPNRRKKDESQEASTATKDAIVQPIDKRTTKSRARSKSGSVDDESVKFSDNEDKETSRRPNRRKKDESQESTKSLEKPVDPIEKRATKSRAKIKPGSQDSESLKTGASEDKETNRKSPRRKKDESQEPDKSSTKADDSQEATSKKNTSRKRSLEPTNVDSDDDFVPKVQKTDPAEKKAPLKKTPARSKTKPKNDTPEETTPVPTELAKETIIRKSARSTRKNPADSEPEVISIASTSTIPTEVISVSSSSTVDEPAQKTRRLSANSRLLKKQLETSKAATRKAIQSPPPSPKKKIEVLPTPERNKRQLKPKVVFTMMDNPELESLIRQLGGSVVDTSDACTVLVTESVKRSQKLLYAVGQAKPICSPEWLYACKKAYSFVDPWDYILVDKEAEKKWSFSLRESLSRSAKAKLLDNYTFQIMVGAGADVLKGAIESCGGKCVTRNLAKASTDNIMIVSTSANQNKYSKIVKQNPEIKVVEPEAIFDGTLRQEFMFDKFLLT